MRLILLPVLCAASLVAACDDNATSPTDTTGGDSTADTGGGDTTSTDTATNDSTPTDTGTTDTGTTDTGTTDTGTTDTGTTDTGTTDTGTTDTGTTDTGSDTDTTTSDGAGLCPGILSCIAECTTQQCYQTCLGAAESNDEAAYVQEYIVCLDDNGCFPDVASGEQPTDQQIIDSIKCEHEHCLDANAECSSGGVYGAGTCSNIFVCLNECASNTDIPCQRACFSGASQEAVAGWYDLNYCLNEECYTADDFSTCAQTAVQAPPCQLAYTACTGDAGAAPGAAGGGSFKPNRFDMRSFGK